uniref:Uncharacterized protein MANES_01G042800 n=1 Tax=Rhizophora mucronata TaxID=61149 RepID=A0A2P2LQI4_RHIMU
MTISALLGIVGLHVCARVFVNPMIWIAFLCRVSKPASLYLGLFNVLEKSFQRVAGLRKVYKQPGLVQSVRPKTQLIAADNHKKSHFC